MKKEEQKPAKEEPAAKPWLPGKKDSEECKNCMAEFGRKEAEYRKKVDELVDTLKRLQAEFENYRKMCEKENVDFRKYAEAKMVSDMLPILDTFEAALDGTSGNDEFSRGILLIKKKFHELLKQRGLKQIEAVGKKFDPYYHEVMMCAESDNEDGIVLEELQKGYMLHDKVLRHSKVKVSKKKDDAQKQNIIK